MRNSKSHTKTISKKLNKSKKVFHAFNMLQFKYGEKLDNDPDVVDIQANYPLSDLEDGNYTTDFYFIKTSGEIVIRECVYQDTFLKPRTLKLLDLSRTYWLSRGITNWGIVFDEK